MKACWGQYLVGGGGKDILPAPCLTPPAEILRLCRKHIVQRSAKISHLSFIFYSPAVCLLPLYLRLPIHTYLHSCGSFSTKGLHSISLHPWSQIVDTISMLSIRTTGGNGCCWHDGQRERVVYHWFAGATGSWCSREKPNTHPGYC